MPASDLPTRTSRQVGVFLLYRTYLRNKQQVMSINLTMWSTMQYHVVVDHIAFYVIHSQVRYNPEAHHLDDSVQDCSNSIANALELLQSCTKKSICDVIKREAVIMLVVELLISSSFLSLLWNYLECKYMFTYTCRSSAHERFNLSAENVCFSFFILKLSLIHQFLFLFNQGSYAIVIRFSMKLYFVHVNALWYTTCPIQTHMVCAMVIIIDSAGAETKIFPWS